MRTISVSSENTTLYDRDPDGTLVLRTRKNRNVAVRPLTPRFSSEGYAMPSFSVLVTNTESQNLTLAPSDIEAWSGLMPVRILTPTVLQYRHAQEVAATIRQASFPATDASQSAERLMSYPTDSTGVVREIRHSTDPAIEPLAVPPRPPPARLLTEALHRQTIPPGEVGGGRVTLEPTDITTGEPLKIIVNLRGETHTFIFSVRD